jgi:hypothetical protein
MTLEERAQYISVRWLDCQLGAEPALDFLRRYRAELSDEIFDEALEAAMADERERCAKIVDCMVNEGNGNPDWPVANLDDVIAAIRKGE